MSAIFDLCAANLQASAHPRPSRVSSAGRCGAQLTYQNDANPDAIDITTASLDQPDAFPPAKESGWTTASHGRLRTPPSTTTPRAARNAAPLPPDE